MPLIFLDLSLYYFQTVCVCVCLQVDVDIDSFVESMKLILYAV